MSAGSSDRGGERCLGPDHLTMVAAAVAVAKRSKHCAYSPGKHLSARAGYRMEARSLAAELGPYADQAAVPAVRRVWLPYPATRLASCAVHRLHRHPSRRERHD